VTSGFLCGRNVVIVLLGVYAAYFLLPNQRFGTAGQSHHDGTNYPRVQYIKAPLDPTSRPETSVNKQKTTQYKHLEESTRFELSRSLSGTLKIQKRNKLKCAQLVINKIQNVNRITKHGQLACL
jgi:hypothetical protein